MGNKPIPASLDRLRSNKDTPSIVLAPAFDDRSKRVNLHVNYSLINQYGNDNFLAKLGEFAGLVHGNIDSGTFGLLETKSLFKGIRRPCLESNFDSEIYVYITNPDFTYTYRGIPKYSGRPPQKIEAPINSIFATYVKFYPDSETAAKESGLTDYEIAGVVLDWEWVLADPKNPELPDLYKASDLYKARYDECIW